MDLENSAVCQRQLRRFGKWHVRDEGQPSRGESLDHLTGELLVRGRREVEQDNRLIAISRPAVCQCDARQELGHTEGELGLCVNLRRRQ